MDLSTSYHEFGQRPASVELGIIRVSAHDEHPSEV
jgi:hypothetical protein